MEILSGEKIHSCILDQRLNLLYWGRLSFSTKHTVLRWMYLEWREKKGTPAQPARLAKSMLAIIGVTDIIVRSSLISKDGNSSHVVIFVVVFLGLPDSASF